jgi:hypothetical protein
MLFESVNLKSKEEYETPVTQPFITAEELKVSLNVRPNITFATIWNLIKRARNYVSLNVRPNITFATIWNLIKRARNYDAWPESIYYFPGSYVGRNMNDIKCMRCGKTATSLIYYNGLSIDVCGGCLFYYGSDASFAYPQDNESTVDCGKK